MVSIMEYSKPEEDEEEMRGLSLRGEWSVPGICRKSDLL
jgi:hypothetical protein